MVEGRAAGAAVGRPVGRAALLLALVSGLVVVPLGRAEAVQRPETLYDERPVAVGVVEPGFPIDQVGVVVDLPDDADAHHDHEGGAHGGVDGVEVRFRTDGRWGAWQPVAEDGAQQAGQWTGALVPAGDAEAYQVRGVPAGAVGARAAALNTTDGPLRTVGHRPAATAHAVSSCKSRLDWGADESLRTSERSYADVQLLTVHHTATANGDPEPDARVRAIYEYHVRTNRWADIGYQALISEDGTVYEGRWSGSDSPSCLSAAGTGWEFGHQSGADGTTGADAHAVVGAHTGGYNTGNFGVALLGTLTDVPPKPAARSALVAYLAELADRHGLDPTATVAYDNGTNSGTFETISGHRDFSATECPGGVLYADLPAIRSDVAAAMSGSSNAAPVVTITAPADADTYTVKEATADAGATVTFAAGGTDDATASTELTWQWTDEIGGTVATTASFEPTLKVGTYTYTATATDEAGTSGSDTITVTVVAADSTSTVVSDDVASGEQPVAGTVSGSYEDTHRNDDGAAEQITEVASGGRPAQRQSLLEHVWTVPVTGGTSVTLFVDASTTAMADGDGFAFAYSSDGGASYTSVLTIPAGTDGVHSASLPPRGSTTLQVRVTDTDRTEGNATLDTVAVDHLFVRSESGTASTPAVPAGFSATASSATSSTLTWTDVDGEHGYELERSADGGNSWSAVASLGVDATSHSDSGLAAETTYGYRLRAHNSAGPSAWTEASVKTPAASSISLTTTGRKVQGSHVVELSWTGATKVVVYRDGNPLWSWPGSSYTDETGGKGTGSYTHQVCTSEDPATQVCSPEVVTTFS